MQLISLHINNFGKLSNLDLDFSKGLNTFIHENGWGKTTLSVFIKSILYGMEYTTSKDVDKNERLKYLPWQGGNYGGSLRFTHGGKEYLITRTFSMKKDEDTFELRDLKTNKLSSDFSSDLGNELFGINRKTYSRSVHVVLDQVPEVSDDISAKLNNLIESGDVSAFEPAVKKLNEKISDLKMRGQKGELYRIQNEIDFLNNKIKEIDDKILQNGQLENKISSINKDVEELKKQQEKVTELLSASAKYEGKLRYEQLKKDLDEGKERLKVLSDFFNGQIPDEETLFKIDEISRDYTTVNANISNLSLSQSELDQYEELKKSFAGDIPTKEQIEACLKTEREYYSFRQNESLKKLNEEETAEYSLLKQRFGGAELSEQGISKKLSEFSEVQSMNNELHRLGAEKSSLAAKLENDRQAKKKNPLKILSGLFALLSAGTGAASFVLHLGKAGLFAGFGLALLFSVIFLAAYSSGSKDLSEKEKELSELEEKINTLKNKCEEGQKSVSAFISRFSGRKEESYLPEGDSASWLSLLNKISIDFSRYLTLHSKASSYFTWLQNQPKVACDFENELKAFVSRFCKSQDISAVSNQIQTLNEKVNRLQALEAKVNSDAKNRQLSSDKKEKLLQILNQYKTEKTLDFSAQVQQLHNKINDIKNTKELLSNLNEKVRDFENDPQNDVASYDKLKKPEEKADQLQLMLSKLSDNINEKNAEISNYRRIIEANLSETDKIEEIKNDIALLKHEKEEKTERYDILSATLNFLTQARENLDANYSDPMKAGFEKYISLLEGTAPSLLINTDLNVMVDNDGKLYDSKYLSAGYKDMVNFCSRMALVDALFEDVKPPLLLDDPFVNLDDEKTAKALKLVSKMAEEKQILYFACHKSRVVK